MKAYTGVGSRDISDEESVLIALIATHLATEGYEVWSGKAQGADWAFCHGAKAGDGAYTNFKPWRSFNGIDKGDHCLEDSSVEAQEKAAEIASAIHPAWGRCSRGARLLHTRNVMQVLGAELNQKSEFLLACSDEDSKGDVKGGTRTAWMLAKQNHIPCLNVRGKTWEDVMKWLKGGGFINV